MIPSGLSAAAWNLGRCCPISRDLEVGCTLKAVGGFKVTSRNISVDKWNVFIASWDVYRCVENVYTKYSPFIYPTHVANNNLN